MTNNSLRVALFSDREDWILGTTAHEIKRCLGRSGKFDFVISSEDRIYNKPVHELKKFGKCDLVHWISPGGNLSYSSLFKHIPQIVTIHHCIDGDAHWPFNYKGVNKFLTVSCRSQRELIDRGFLDVEVVHNGVNHEIFRPLSQTECRHSLNLKNISFPLIGFFGKESSNPMDRKGTQALLNSLSDINRHKQVGVLLSGEGWGALRERLTTLKIPVFQKQVRSIEDMPLLYGAIDLYLCTSRIEGGPVTVLEAMACKKPVVSTPVGHVTELIRHGENGLLVPIDDREAMACGVLNLLSDSLLAEKLGENGRETVLRSWTWDVVLQPLAGVYNSAVESGSIAKYSPYQYSKDLFTLLARSLRRRLWLDEGFSNGGSRGTN